MSSTNRGRVRNRDDFYSTPPWLIEALIPTLKNLLTGIAVPDIWEPCAGDGRIAQVLEHHFPNARIYRSDITQHLGNHCTRDFLDFEPGGIEFADFDLIITNPPFLIAEKLIRHSFDFLRPGGTTIALERIGFLGSKQREPWLANHVPDIALSPRRASFLPTHQADSVEYSWLSWTANKRTSGKLTYLDTMTCDMCDVHYDKICSTCDFGHCNAHKDHECKMFGREALWFCYKHPDRPMTNACRAKGCSLPFCDECWAEHANGKWRACTATE